jgi:hypothetical protein
MTDTYLVVKSRRPRRPLVLSKRGGIEGRRDWSNLEEKHRIEHFDDRSEAENACATYGGKVVEARKFPYLR